MNMAANRYAVVRPGFLFRREQLDKCLNAVEEALERGENVVSVHLERILRPLVPSVGRGMFLVVALEHVFASQEQLFAGQRPELPLELHLASDNEDPSPVSWSCSSVEPHMARGLQISEADAKDLTARIRDGLGEFPILLLEAHEKRVWVPLRHKSWEQYVRLEFSLSRSRSYELLDQARVMRALRLAAPTQRIRPISALAATQIKPLLGEVVDELRRHVVGQQEVNVTNQIDSVVRDVVARARGRVAASRASRSVSQSRPLLPGATHSTLRLLTDRVAQPDAATTRTSPSLIDVLALLAHQAPAADVLRSLSLHEYEQLVQLPQAVRWLEELLAAWSSQRARSSAETGQPTKRHRDAGPQGRIRRSLSASQPASVAVAGS